MLDRASRRYVERMAEIVEATLGPETVGVYLVGSVAYGDYAVGRSDIDVLVVARHAVSKDVRTALPRRLDHEQLPCPALGLDLGIFLSETVSKPPRVPTYELAVATGANWDLEVSEDGGESELLIDFAVCRRLGVSVAGLPAKDAFGEVPRDWLRDAMRTSVQWSREHVHHSFHDPLGHFAVLNGCRAWRYLEEGVLCSKSEGGAWALGRLPAREVIGEALAIRRGERRNKLDRDRVRDFIDEVAAL
jgi:hypothetical protein